MASPSPDWTAAIVREPLVVSPETPVTDAIARMANAQLGGINAHIRCSCVVWSLEGRWWGC
ncbi:MAG: hypothetical protein HC812_03965 [Leptolyngbya sp. RL_3_1]|nr:hypothetical protein [Leptolyngbya sp. RL_3_1]